MGKITRHELSPKLNAEIDALGEKINLDLFLAAVTFNTNVFSATDNRIKQYVNGLRISFKSPVTADLNNSVIKINGFANAPLKKANGAALNKVYQNGVYTFVYSDGNFIVQGEGGEYGNATPAQVLAGKTIGTENGLVTGTIIHRSDEAFHQLSNGIAYMESKAFTRPPKGYYDGESWVYSNEPDIKPANILSGKKIFDVQGGIPNFGRAVLGQGYTNPKSYKADGGGSLVIEPNTGYYEQGLNANSFGSILVNDPNFVAANIVSGKSIFGVNGAATAASLGGLRMASGVASSTDRSYLFHCLKNGSWTTTSYSRIEVNGLGGRPKFIMVSSTQNNNPFAAFYSVEGVGTSGGYTANYADTGGVFAHPAYTQNYVGLENTQVLVINDTGFFFPAVYTYQTYNWIAFY